VPAAAGRRVGPGSIGQRVGNSALHSAGGGPFPGSSRSRLSAAEQQHTIRPDSAYTCMRVPSPALRDAGRRSGLLRGDYGRHRASPMFAKNPCIRCWLCPPLLHRSTPDRSPVLPGHVIRGWSSYRRTDKRRSQGGDSVNPLTLRLHWMCGSRLSNYYDLEDQ
jgi:hypothetical protein